MNGSNKRKRSSVIPVRPNSGQQMNFVEDNDALFIDEKCSKYESASQSPNGVCIEDSEKLDSATDEVSAVVQNKTVGDDRRQILRENENSTRNLNLTTAPHGSNMCCECSENFAEYSSFLVHVRRHLDYKPYQCSACNFQGFDNEEVRLHCSEVHIDQPWKILHKSKIDIEIKVRQMVQNSKAPSNNHNAEKLDSEIDQNLVADDDVNPDCKRIKIQNFNKTMNKNLADHSKKNFASGGSAIKIGPSTGGILSSLLRGDLVPQQTALTTDNKFSCSAIANHSSPFLSSPAASNVDEDSLLICGFCEESVSHNAVSVLRHLKAHARFGTYNCSLCESMCSNLAEFEFHLTQSHGTSSSPKFPPIVDFLARAKRFRRDETIRLVETAFGRTANGIGRVNTARIKCHLCCEMVNWRRDALVSHLRSHLGLSPYICARCSSSFVDHASMYDHFAAKHLGAEADFFTFAYNFDPKADTDLDGAYEKCFPALSTKLLEELCGENRVDSVIQTVNNGVGDHRLSLFSQSGSFAPYTSPVAGLSGHQPKSLTDLTVVCALCTAKISNNLSCMIAHVKVHLDYKPLKCDYCTFKYFSMSRIRRHNSKVHPDKPVKVSYHPIPDIGKKIKEMKKRCFGSTSSGSAATTTFTTSISTSANEDEESMGDEDNDSPLTDVSRNSPADTNTGYGSQNAQLNVSSLLRNLIKNQFPDQQQANSVSKNRSLTDNLVAFNHRPGASNNISSTSLQQGQFSDSIVASNGQSVQKRLCRLCNTYIANSTSAFENHASRHLNYKPYSCAACSYKSYVRGKVSRHSLQVHGVRAPRGVVFKPLPGMKEKMRQVKLKCFYNPYLDQQDLIRKNGDNNDSASPSNNSGGYPNQLIDVATVDLSGNEDDDNNSTDSFSGAGSLALPVSNGQDGSELSRSKLPCAICFEWVADDSVLLKSHAAIHASSTTYMCSLCEFRDSSEARFREHAMNVHGDMHLKAKCKIDHHLIGKIRNMCFPSHQFVNSDDDDEDDDEEGDDEISIIPENHQNSSPFKINNNVVGKAGSSSNDFLSYTVRYSENGFKRLTCHLCYGTIADNPKSIGIHLKNHLNYKPYRCPFCTYMSCEQSKARRHVENVHNLSGDKIHIFEENDIKDKLVVVKAQCFPSLSQLPPNETRKSVINIQDSAPEPVIACVICEEKFAFDEMNDHARFHMPEAICCNYCSKIFVDKEDGDLHYEFAHKDLEPSFGNVEENSATLNCVKEICFPNIASTYNRDDDHTVAALPVEKIEKCGQNSMPSSSNNMFAATMIMNDLKNKVSSSSGVKSAPFSRTISSNKSRGANIKPPSPVHLEGRVQCRICSQWISLNPNSIDVHVKNHLEFKQHVCGYCPYRSCIIGKVKRHLDSVHKNEPMKVLSFTQTSAKLKSIVLDARSICFLLGDPSDKDYEPDVLAEMLDNTRIQLDEELTALSENMSASDKILARCSGPQVNAGHQKLSMEHFFSDTTSSANNNNSKSNISLNHNSTSTTTRKSNSTTNFAAATLDELQHQNNMTDFCAQFLSTPDEDDDSPSINLLNEFLDRPDDDITDVFLDGLNPTCCRLCEKNLPEHTTTMDFHARNHLTYKPFHCDLCNYKSSLEAKVKRHLHVVHNCSQADDRVVFSPAPSVLEKLHQIKVACFGDKFSAVKSNDPRLMGSAESHEKLFDVEDSIEDYRRLHEMLEEDQLENSLTASDVVNNVPLSHCKETSIHMEDNHERVEITCNICCESVPNDNLSKTKHMTKHVGDFEYRCQYCDFVSFVNQETVKHSAAEHPNEPPRAGRYNLSSHMASAAYERLADQCFSEQDRKNRSDNAYNRVMRTFNSFGDEEENLNGNADDAEMGSSAEPASDEEPLPVDNAETLTFSSSKFDTFNVDGTKYICRLCQTAVSMHSSSLYVHVKNHMNYKPYVCGYCDYRSPVKSKVRRHIINQHKTISGSPIVHYIPRPGVDKDILRWKIKCFPETASHAAAALAVLNSGAAPTIAAASSSLSKHRPSMSFEETHREIRRNSQHIVDVARDKPTATLHAAQPLSSKTTLQAAGTASTSKSGLSVDRAAPSSMAAISAITSGGSDRIPCLLCKMVVADNPGSKGIHAKNHLNSKPFHCAYCSYKSCLRGETKRHLNRQHPAMAMSIAFKEDEVATKIELDDMIERCFLTGEPKDASSTERPNNHNRIKDPNKKKGKLEPETKFQREETVASIAAATPPSDSQTSKTSKIETSKNNSSYCNNRRKSEPQKVTVNSDKNNSSACYNLRTTRSTTKKLMEFDSSD